MKGADPLILALETARSDDSVDVTKIWLPCRIPRPTKVTGDLVSQVSTPRENSAWGKSDLH